MNSKLFLSVFGIIIFTSGFVIGKTTSSQNTDTEWKPREIPLEMSLIELKQRNGDVLKGTVSGKVRILWGDDQYLESKNGNIEIPLGQIYTEDDLEFFQFSYVGNAKTNKFYPSDSYPARGTEPKYRRFFKSRSEAEEAGFIPMKNM